MALAGQLLYLTTLSIAQIVEPRMIRWLVNNELEMVWYIACCPNLKYYPKSCLEGLIKSMNKRQDSRSPDRHLDPGAPKYEA
jgi:hypothetical protein